MVANKVEIKLRVVSKSGKILRDSISGDGRSDVRISELIEGLFKGLDDNLNGWESVVVMVRQKEEDEI